MSDFMIDLASRWKYAEYLINTISEKSLGYLDKMLESCGGSIDIVYMADDYCSQRAPLFSPGLFKKFVMPYLRKVADRVHKHNKKFLTKMQKICNFFNYVLKRWTLLSVEDIGEQHMAIESVAKAEDLGTFISPQDLSQILSLALWGLVLPLW